MIANRVTTERISAITARSAVARTIAATTVNTTRSLEAGDRVLLDHRGSSW